jgi:hypothetical protein
MNLDNLTKPFAGDHCLLCGGKPHCVALFKPDNPMLYGAAAGKTRFIRYCLCEKCRTKPNTPERVEKAILAELTGAEVIYE